LLTLTTMTDDDLTDFGFKRIPAAEKARQVRGIFDSVADRYDVMNDVMSFGIHRIWKRIALEFGHIRAGQRILDLATGTGDLAARLCRAVGPRGEIVASDINAAMLARGRDRCVDQGLAGNIEFVQADAEHLPFADEHFDAVIMAFGLRNVTHKEQALAQMYRVLKPGGQALILEFSRPSRYVEPLYDLYSHKALPLMGKVIVDDADSYRYLAESIRMHPPQEELKAMMEEAGLEDCGYTNLTGGIVAIHRGYKY